MLSDILLISKIVYQGTTVYKYRVDGVVWEYLLDSALDPAVSALAVKGSGKAYNFVKENSKTISRDGVAIDDEN